LADLVSKALLVEKCRAGPATISLAENPNKLSVAVGATAAGETGE